MWNDPLGMFFRQLIDDLGHSPRYRSPPASVAGGSGGGRCWTSTPHRSLPSWTESARDGMAGAS